MVKKFWVGITTGSPTVGTNFLVSDFISTSVVDFLTVDKCVFDGIGDVGASDPDDWPDFVQNIGESKITLLNYTFGYKCRLLVSYTPICLNPNPCTES